MCPDGLVALTTADLLPLGGLVDATVDEEEVEGEEALDPTVFGPSTSSYNGSLVLLQPQSQLLQSLQTCVVG